MTKNKILLAILILASILRLYKLDKYPVSLSWDEVAIGYNAYSIAQTGKDEYGQKFPLLSKSFNDYKLPGYIYLDSIFIKLFGLSIFTVRLPSAISGILAVYLIYILTKKILVDAKFQPTVPVISAFLLAINPWHLQISRAAFETNAALTLILAGFTMLFYSLKARSDSSFGRLGSILALPALALSIYFYYSPRLFVPLFLLIIFVFFKKAILQNLKYYLISSALAILVAIPLIFQILTPIGAKRVSEVSIFAEQSLITDYVEASSKSQNYASKLFLNRRIPITFEAFHNYFSHFSFGFSFFGDDPNPRHKSAFHGNFYLFEIATILIGIWIVLKSVDKRIKYLILAWLLLAPVPAAFTKETPHGLRALLMLPPLVILSALGFAKLWQYSKIRMIYILIIAVFFINYLYSYYLIYPIKSSTAWAFGYQQLFSKVKELDSNFDRVIITGNYWKPYIFYLFYNQIDPNLYQSNPDQASIGKYRFGIAIWDTFGKDFDD